MGATRPSASRARERRGRGMEGRHARGPEDLEDGDGHEPEGVERSRRRSLGLELSDDRGARRHAEGPYGVGPEAGHAVVAHADDLAHERLEDRLAVVALAS